MPKKDSRSTAPPSCTPSAALTVQTVPLERVIPYARNPRTKNGPGSAAVAKVAASLKAFGWRQPIVVDPEYVVIAGHTRLLAARHLGMTQVPVHIAEGLTAAQAKAYRLADNRTGQEAEWDAELLGLEIGDLKEAGLDLAVTGFGAEELGLLLDEATPLMFEAAPDTVEANVADLEAIRAQRAKGNAATATKGDTENYLVLVYPSRAGREAALSRLGLPTDERYLDGGTIDLRLRLGRTRRPGGDREVSAATPRHSGAHG